MSYKRKQRKTEKTMECTSSCSFTSCHLWSRSCKSRKLFWNHFKY